MDKITVSAVRKTLSELIGTKVEPGENLMENKGCSNFIEKYKDYFNSTDSEKIREFFDKTGIALIHIFKSDNGYFYFNELSSGFDRPYRGHTFNNDLIVITYVKNIEKTDKELIADGKVIYKLGNNFDINKFSGIQGHIETCASVEEKLLLLKNGYNYDLKFDFKEVKQVKLDSFGKLFVLFNNGDLLCNNYKYETNVKWMWTLDTYTTYLIFNDNNISTLTSKHINASGHVYYDKIVYVDEVFLALIDEYGCTLHIKDSEELDTSVELYFKNINDVEYKAIYKCDECGQEICTTNRLMECNECGERAFFDIKTQEIILKNGNIEIPIEIPAFLSGYPIVETDLANRPNEYFCEHF